MTNAAKPDIYTYTDYRAFVRDFFAHQKRVSPAFSHAYFAHRAGFQSRTFMIKIMKGEKSLSRLSIERVSAAMGLGKKESAYFANLVLFNDAQTSDEKQHYFDHLLSSHKSNKALLLRNDQYEYFGTWYLPVLREVVTYLPFDDDYEVLGAAFTPPISSREARAGVKLLLRLGLIRREGSLYVQTDAVVTTGNEIRSLAVQQFQRKGLELASAALSAPASMRDISTLTFGTTAVGFAEVKDAVVAFRKRLIEVMLRHAPADRVYQLSMQLFPLAGTEAPEKDSTNA